MKWRMLGTGNSTGGEWLSSLSCMDPTDKSYVVATEISLTRQRVRQFRMYRRLSGNWDPHYESGTRCGNVFGTLPGFERLTVSVKPKQAKPILDDFRLWVIGGARPKRWG